MGMSNDQRAEYGKLHWTPAINAWGMGMRLKDIAQIMGYRNEQSLKTKIQQLRKKHPDWFPPRSPGFKPLILSRPTGDAF